VYELIGTPPRKIVACNDKCRQAARRAANLKVFACAFCGKRGRSPWPRKYCCEPHGEKARRRAKVSRARVVKLERVKSSLRTVCWCGEKLDNPAPECGFCRGEREPRECKRREALERLGVAA
jgi:hypothetical protein